MKSNETPTNRRIFLSMGVWNPNFTNPKLGDRPQLWPILPSDDEFGFVLLSLLLTLNIFYTLFWCFYC